MKGLLVRGTTYYARKVVPPDVRPLIGKSEWIVSLHTDSACEAVAVQRDLEKRWKADIVSARIALANKPIDLIEVEKRVGWWGTYVSTIKGWSGFDPVELPDPRTPKWRRTRTGFELTSAARRPLVIVNGLLEGAIAKNSGWESIHELDDMIEGAMSFLDIEVGKSHPSFGDVRLIFARGWLTQLRATEQGRQTMAARAHLNMVSSRPLAQVIPAGEPEKTVLDLISGYRADRLSRYDQESTDRRYSHIFEALAEGLGPDKVLSSITRADCRKVRDFIRVIPPTRENATELILRCKNH